MSRNCRIVDVEGHADPVPDLGEAYPQVHMRYPVPRLGFAEEEISQCKRQKVERIGAPARQRGKRFRLKGRLSGTSNDELFRGGFGACRRWPAKFRNARKQ